MRTTLDHLKASDRLRDAYAQAIRRFSGRPGVLGIGIGLPMSNGKIDDNRKVIRVFVEEKLPAEAVDDRHLIPTRIDGIRVDVQALCMQGDTHDTASFDDTTMAAQAELRPGISIGNAAGPPGTLGLIATSDGKPCLVSADHVLAPLTSSSQDVYQPAPADGGAGPEHLVGRVWRVNRALGVATASVSTMRSLVRSPMGTTVVVKKFRLPKIGETVTKVGRSTDKTHGVVRDFVSIQGCARGFVIWPAGGTRTNVEISKGGDSGAVWYSEDDSAGIAIQERGEPDGVPNQEWAVAAGLVYAADALNFRPW